MLVPVNCNVASTLASDVYENSNDVINPSNVNIFILRISACSLFASIPGYNLRNFSILGAVVSNNNPALPVSSLFAIADSGCTISNLTNRPG